MDYRCRIGSDSHTQVSLFQFEVWSSGITLSMAMGAWGQKLHGCPLAFVRVWPEIMVQYYNETIPYGTGSCLTYNYFQFKKIKEHV